MPDDVGGKPFPDGWEPDDDRGGADKDFASVVFDEDFVRAAVVHEPTAVERLLAAAEARAQADARARRSRRPTDGEYGSHRRPRLPHDPQDVDYDPDDHDASGSYGPGGYRGAARWHRPVAWLLALVMGVGMVALAFSAVHRIREPGGPGGPARHQRSGPARGDSARRRGPLPPHGLRHPLRPLNHPRAMGPAPGQWPVRHPYGGGGGRHFPPLSAFTSPPIDLL